MATPRTSKEFRELADRAMSASFDARRESDHVEARTYSLLHLGWVVGAALLDAVTDSAIAATSREEIEEPICAQCERQRCGECKTWSWYAVGPDEHCAHCELEAENARLRSEQEEYAESRRQSLVNELHETLKTRGLWAPDNGADLLTAVARALDDREADNARLRKVETAARETLALLGRDGVQPGWGVVKDWLRAALSTPDEPSHD